MLLTHWWVGGWGGGGHLEKILWGSPFQGLLAKKTVALLFCSIWVFFWQGVEAQNFVWQMSERVCTAVCRIAQNAIFELVFVQFWILCIVLWCRVEAKCKGRVVVGECISMLHSCTSFLCNCSFCLSLHYMSSPFLSSPLNAAWVNHTSRGWHCICGEGLSILSGTGQVGRTLSAIEQ